MLYRIKQVFAALTASITPKDREFIEQHLSSKAQNLFWAMNVPDQRHVLNVAYTALHLADNHSNVNSKLLVKCALLHDVGKVKGDVSTVDKIITVIGDYFFPNQLRKWGKQGRGSKVANLRHAFYIYFHHAAISAGMLREIGESPEMIEIIAKHHKTPAENDPLELTLLRESDSMH
ncbi:HDIG domain-containing metalloprotein [Pelosinus baikalensis]|jgi:putative nucleotidyltransferase with HDIG domain|uniref:HDIG domain-containing protein n=1 Tax=Pelosinus baikalensis TaxID=2892015 RepID=A0ABS8HTH9_9FIRM|nr:HDIG domain-containing metalloprotein [Pelosinus baikalensis]MCC5465174.1 HDIG domain-containing protein [Pelosinus baikalensis]MCC5465211.1 HDIG domain-containing protein [Pelosinus baikalensis]